MHAGRDVWPSQNIDITFKCVLSLRYINIRLTRVFDERVRKYLQLRCSHNKLKDVLNGI